MLSARADRERENWKNEMALEGKRVVRAVPDPKEFSYGPTSGLAGFRSAEVSLMSRALPPYRHGPQSEAREKRTEGRDLCSDPDHNVCLPGIRDRQIGFLDK
jgi:hypothetical protein